jgi:CO/xanthine dehydrogenase FAD-binding subunit
MTEYLIPTSIAEAIGLLDTYHGEARIIAGGTDVMPDMRRQKIRPRCLVDITRIPGLDQITVMEDFIEVGAAVTFAAIKDSLFLNQHVHALADAARSVGAVAIQNVATWVGNIVQAMPAADGAIVAIALEAEARLVDRHGARWRPVESLFSGPGVSAVDPSRQFVTHIRFPHPQSPWGTAWARVGRRPSLVLPILNCAVKLCLAPLDVPGNGDSEREGMQIAHACVALGPVAPRPFRARQAELFLSGQPPTAEVFAQAARIAQGESNPRSSIMRASRDYRLTIIPSLVSDALAVAAARAASADH